MPFYYDNQAEKDIWEIKKIVKYSQVNVYIEIFMTLFCMHACVSAKFAYYCVWLYWRLLVGLCV